MDKRLDEAVARARANAHDAGQALHEAHSTFVAASARYELALEKYREANKALCSDDKRMIDKVADAHELAKALDSTARLKAQTAL